MRLRAEIVVAAILGCSWLCLPQRIASSERWIVLGVAICIAAAARVATLERWYLKILGIVGMMRLTIVLATHLKTHQYEVWPHVQLLGVLCMMGGTLEYLPRAVVRCRARVNCDESEAIGRKRPRLSSIGRWATLLALCSFWLMVALPFRDVFFLASLRSFEAKVREVHARNKGFVEPQIVGFYRIRYIAFQPRGTIEFTTGGYFSPSVGFLYLPEGQSLGPPISSRRILFTEHWYEFSRY